ncbi:MAG: glycosyltransferase family 2 protein [Planctomycetes bacterium]|nr:glycosyltransferase family 2 protein [Planctomycetota bacterium]
MAEFSIVIPAFNEADAIGPVLARLSAVMVGSGLSHEILVVDDGSTDGTGRAVQAVLDRLPHVRLLQHAANRGYGAALKTGIRAASADVVAITDADGTYPNERLPDLYQTLVTRRADMVVGARIGDNVHIPLVRRPAKAALGMLANYLSGTRIPDLNSGLRVFRKAPVVERFNLISNGFSFTTTVTLALLARSHPVVFVPIDYARRTGSSKIRPIRDTFNFLVLILRVSVYFEPLKVFLPTAGALAVGGLAYGGLQAWEGDLGEGPVLLLVAALQVLLVGLIADMISRKN